MELPDTRIVLKYILPAVVFTVFAIVTFNFVPSIEIGWVCAILLLTVYLFAFEVLEVDVTAVTIMVLLGLTALFGPLIGLEEPLVPATELFEGFASNAVISIIAVMILGAGLDKTGVVSKVANFILRVGGTTERRIIPLISSSVGVISSFMQNVGAAALFLPVVSRISSRTGLPLSRLLMPMGFCAILGGTITMVGSSPLILLNDLILNSNERLTAQGYSAMDTFGLFSVTPVGIALVITGILYFIVAGRFVLPSIKAEGTDATSALEYFRDLYGLDYDLKEIEVPEHSPAVDQELFGLERHYGLRIVGMRLGDTTPTLSRDVVVKPGSILGVLAPPAALKRFVDENALKLRRGLIAFAETLSPTHSGIAEVVIPPGSKLIGKSARDVWLRKTYGLSTLAIHRSGKTIREKVRDVPFQDGDTLVCHTIWESLARLEKDRNFVVVTTEYPHEELRPQKISYALGFLGLALCLVLFSDLKLSVSLLTGALGMVLSGVLTMDEAYEAVSWKTVFLLASLIPLGFAVEHSGTATWIATQTLAVLGDVPIWGLQTAVAVLATIFTLVMSNVGATVLLVPLAVNIAVQAGADPGVFALTVAVATSNSFLIPTHQVNALIMGPAGYRVVDYMRAGGIMTILFLFVSLPMLNLVF